MLAACRRTSGATLMTPHHGRTPTATRIGQNSFSTFFGCGKLCFCVAVESLFHPVKRLDSTMPNIRKRSRNIARSTTSEGFYSTQFGHVACLSARVSSTEPIGKDGWDRRGIIHRVMLEVRAW